MDLSQWRARIDALDEIVVDLLNRRMQYAQEVGKLKRARGRQLRDLERERQLLERLKEYNAGPLSAGALEDIFRRIIQEAISLEEE